MGLSVNRSTPDLKGFVFNYIPPKSEEQILPYVTISFSPYAAMDCMIHSWYYSNTALTRCQTPEKKAGFDIFTVKVPK
jgi:hypothetical protein